MSQMGAEGCCCSIKQWIVPTAENSLSPSICGFEVVKPYPGIMAEPSLTEWRFECTWVVEISSILGSLFHKKVYRVLEYKS